MWKFWYYTSRILGGVITSMIFLPSIEMKAAGFFRKPIDGAALVDAIDWAIQ